MEQPTSPWGALHIPASLRTHCAYQNFFHPAMPIQLLCCCLLVWKEKSSSVPPAWMLIFHISFWRLRTQQGGRQPALPPANACSLRWWHRASWVALWRCGTVGWMGWYVVATLECPGCWLRGDGARSKARALLSFIQQAALSQLSELSGFLRAAPAKAGWMKLW